MSRDNAAPNYRAEILMRMLVVLGLVVVPQLPRLPPWLITAIIGLGVSCYLTTRQSFKPAPLWLRILLSTLLLTAVYAYYGTLLGRDVGSALLLAMLALKLLEIKAIRDIYITVFLGYFLIIVGFLYSQSLWMAGYMVVMVALLTSILIDLNHNGTTPVTANLRVAAGLLLRALPLAVILFVLFPRISGPIWGLPKDTYEGMIGLGDRMTPGLISNLVQSDAVAFRANFDGPIPPAAQRYWRGPVMWETNGNGWSMAPRRHGLADRHPPTLKINGNAVRYTVTLEPHNRRWLYALDLVTRAPPDAVITSDFLLVHTTPVRERLRYNVISDPEGIASRLTDSDRQRALELPPDGNPRARALAQGWRRRLHDPAAVVQQALAMFRQQPFIYSLHPPIIRDDFVDHFLFDTRKGFCEHYAASFTFLMRAAGIPARVVTGYQGGELNPIGNYLIVRQRDAHAWSEVWLDGRGWTRVDPTAAVAPERIERSIDDNLQPLDDSVHFEIPHPAWLGAVWRETRFAWDAINNKWNQWVLSYGPHRQADLLGWLRFAGLGWQGVAILLLNLIGTLIVAVTAISLKRDRHVEDAVVRAYQTFCAKLERRGVKRRAYEGPSDFAQRVAAQRPDIAEQVHTIIRLYTSLRYGKHQASAARVTLRHAVRRFHP